MRCNKSRDIIVGLFFLILFSPWILFFAINYFFEIPFHFNIIFIIIFSLFELAILPSEIEIKRKQKIETIKQYDVVQKMCRGGSNS